MIASTGIGALLVRTAVSLGVVLAIVAVAYLVARRRSGGVAQVDRSRFSRRRSAPPPIEVVGRVGLTRGTAAVAVRFGPRVVLIAAAEQGPSSVVADMPAEEWDEFRTVREPIQPAAAAPSAAPQIVGAPPSFIEALRQATSRHA